MLGDQPGVSAATVAALLAGRGDSALAACAYDDGRGHPLAFARSTFDQLAALHGDKGVWKLLDRAGDEVVDVPVGGAIPRDVDTWEDYEAVVRERATRDERARLISAYEAASISAATDRHSVTCTFGRTRAETVPARPVEIAWVASEVVAKRCSASAAGTARSRPSVLACHISTIGVPRTSIRVSARRRTSSSTECASVSRIPSPPAAAAIAAAWLAYADDVRRAQAVAIEEQASRRGRIDVGRTHQPALAGELGRRDVRSARQRVARRRHDDQPAAQERHGRDRVRALRPRMGAERDVRLAMLEAVGERCAGDRLDRDLEPVVARGERLDQRPDVLGDEVRGDDLQAARLAGRVVDRAARLLGQAEDLGGERRQAPTAGGQRDPPAFADEQLVAEFLAERRHRDRDRGLGDLELGGRRLDRAEPGDEHERLQLGEGQSVAPKRSLNPS